MFTKNKGARSRKPSSLNKTAIGSASLLTAAEILDYRRLSLLKQGWETIAIKIKYHKSRYVQYASGNIREYVNDTFLKEEKTVLMSELLERYFRKLSQEGVNAPS